MRRYRRWIASPATSSNSRDTQFRELVHLSCEHGLFSSHHNRPLNEFRMFCHYAEQLFIGEFPVCHILVIRDLVRAKYFLRLQAGSVQQSFKPSRRQGLLQVVDSLKIYPFFSQDPLDLAALGSCRFLEKNDFGRALHSSSVNCAQIVSTGLPSPRQNGKRTDVTQLWP
jgi:hypothetical protein